MTKHPETRSGAGRPVLPGRRARRRRDYQPAAGMLLVATSELQDPHFRRTVVYLVAHGEEGSAGLVLNRRTETAVHSVLPGWVSHVAKPQAVYSGGPVQPSGAMCLGVSRGGYFPGEGFGSGAGGRPGGAGRSGQRTGDGRGDAHAESVSSPATRVGARVNWPPRSRRAPGSSSRAGQRHPDRPDGGPVLPLAEAAGISAGLGGLPPGGSGTELTALPGLRSGVRRRWPQGGGSVRLTPERSLSGLDWNLPTLTG